MSEGTTPRPRRRPVIGATAIGLAFGSGAFGMARDVEPDLVADPAFTPPMTQPRDEPTVWAAAAGVTLPAATTPAAAAQTPLTPAAAVDPPAAPQIPTLPPPDLGPAPRPPADPAAKPGDGPMIPTLPPLAGGPSVPAADAPAVPTLPAPKPLPLVAPVSLPKPTDVTLPKPPDLSGPKVPDFDMPKPADVNPAAPATPPAPRLPAPDLGDLGAFRLAAPDSTRPGPSELPAPATLPKPPATPAAEVAPPAPPVKSAEPAQPGAVRPPEFRLRPAASGLNVNTNGGAIPAAEPAAAEFGGFAVPAPAPSPTAPGDFPMPLPSRQLALSAVLGAALAGSAAPLRADGDQKAMPPAVKAEDVAAVTKAVEDLKKDVTDLKKSRDSVDDVLYGSKDGKKSGQEVMTRLDGFDGRLKAIEAALKSIQEALKDPTRSTSAYGAATPAPAPNAAAGRATVRLVNDYPTDVSMVVNGKSHRLTPGEVKTVDVAVGSYTYELLSAGAQPKTAGIKDGETVTLRIN